MAKPGDVGLSVISSKVLGLEIEDIELKDEGEPGPTGERRDTARPWGPARRKNRFTEFCATWTSTAPDAVGITGIRYAVSSNFHIIRRYFGEQKSPFF